MFDQNLIDKTEQNFFFQPYMFTMHELAHIWFFRYVMAKYKSILIKIARTL